MAVTEKTVYETSNGKQFATQKEAEDYEQFEAIKTELCEIVRGGGGIGAPSFTECEKIAYRLMRNADNLTVLLNQTVVHEWNKSNENE